jgi:hypothetical protein
MAMLGTTFLIKNQVKQHAMYLKSSVSEIRLRKSPLTSSEINELGILQVTALLVMMKPSKFDLYFITK